MKIWNILSFVEYWAVAETSIDRILLRIRRCPLASGLFLASVISYGIAFFFALEQSIIMLSNLGPDAHRIPDAYGGTGHHRGISLQAEQQ